ncbi:DUF7139 domain-containing protein [Natrinema limicola]|uniref:Uncharacterized protein n=1 Tax=Natrinema limicola JCM 13563 TaxID=1230457 RepID=M0CF73_9EURY|nr:hypothetical protein [Natrinema limicola]ELZ21308.1 hypothetical protein C476_09073 [Natrinema limicola JCM 13563]
MTSLTEVYDGTAPGVTSRRLYAGTALVILGAILAVVAVLVATTDLFSGYAVELSGDIAAQFATVRVGGALAGLSIPIALVGVFVVLPANRRVQAAAAISVSLCLLGVALFWYAYPTHWRGHNQQLTLEVSVVYLLGLLTSVWSLFSAVATFKRRNDPGGTLQMNVTRHNKTVIEADDDEDASGSLGGIGFLGGTPDGDVETQTNADDTSATLSYDERSSATTSQQSATDPESQRRPSVGTATSDGGSAVSDISSPMDAGDGRDAEIVESTPDQPAEPTDRYCGNCADFEYVRSSEGMVPYCARHETAMDDMDACEEWTPNRQ